MALCIPSFPSVAHAPTDYTKPQQTIQSPDRLYKAPDKLYKAPKRLRIQRHKTESNDLKY